MKRVEGFIKPHRLGNLVAALHALPHFTGFTIFDGHGQGHGRGAGGHYIYEPDQGLLYHKQCLIVVICEDDDASSIAQTIARAAHTGNKGDGIVTISEVLNVVRVRDAGDTP